MPKSGKPVPPARSGSHQRAKPAKRNVSTRKRDKHKKADQESSQTTINEEPETQAVDEETLRREREEARRRWLEEQRKKYPVAPDGYIPNSVVRRTLRVHRPTNDSPSQTTEVEQKTFDYPNDMLFKLKLQTESQVKVLATSKSISFVSSASEKRQKSANAPPKRLQRPFDEFNDVVTQVRQEYDVEDRPPAVDGLERDGTAGPEFKASAASAAQLHDVTEHTTNGEVSSSDVITEKQNELNETVPEDISPTTHQYEDAMAVQDALECLMLADDHVIQSSYELESFEQHVLDESKNSRAMDQSQLVTSSAAREESSVITEDVDDDVNVNADTNHDDVTGSGEQNQELLEGVVSGDVEERSRLQDEHPETGFTDGNPGDVIVADTDAATDLISASLVSEARLKSLPPSRYNSAGNQPNAPVTDQDVIVPTADATLLKSLPPSRPSTAWHQPNEAVDSVDHIVTSCVEAELSDTMEKNHAREARSKQHSVSDEQIIWSNQGISVSFQPIRDSNGDIVIDDVTVTSHGQKIQSLTDFNRMLPDGNRETDRTLELDTNLYVDDDHADAMSLVGSDVIDDVGNDVTDRPTPMGGYVQRDVMPYKTEDSVASTNRELTSPDIDSMSSVRSRSAGGGRKVQYSGIARSNEVIGSADRPISVRFLDSALRTSTFASRTDHNPSGSQRSGSLHHLEPQALTTIDIHRSVLNSVKRSSKCEGTAAGQQTSGVGHSHSPCGSSFLPNIHSAPSCHSCQYSELVKKRMHDHISVGRHLRSVRNAALLCDFSRPLSYSAVKGMTSSFI